MTYHKIRNVEKTVCTSEQVIAYNIAFRIWINRGDDIAALPTAAAQDEAEKRLIRLYISDLIEKGSRYNIDAIFCALNAGLHDYLFGDHHAMINYYDVGRAFPANYL